MGAVRIDAAQVGLDQVVGHDCRLVTRHAERAQHRLQLGAQYRLGCDDDRFVESHVQRGGSPLATVTRCNGAWPSVSPTTACCARGCPRSGGRRAASGAGRCTRGRPISR